MMQDIKLLLGGLAGFGGAVLMFIALGLAIYGILRGIGWLLSKPSAQRKYW